jgi:hypothetical protein
MAKCISSRVFGFELADAVEPVTTRICNLGNTKQKSRVKG